MFVKGDAMDPNLFAIDTQRLAQVLMGVLANVVDITPKPDRKPRKRASR
jgi:hypothetical protein